MRNAADTRNDWKVMDELVRKASEGDRAAENVLVQRYEGLIRKTASEYRSESILCSFEDLMQEAVIGFIEGLRKFDYEKGRDFTEWVRYSMRTAIRKSISEKSRIVALPKWRIEQISKVRKAIAEVSQADGRYTVRDIMSSVEVSGMKEDHIEEALYYMNAGTVSLDAPATGKQDEDRDYASLCSDGEDFTERVEALDMLSSFSSMLSGMDAKQRTVVTGKLGLDGEKKTEKAIGDEIGLSARSVRLIWQKAMSDVRCRMAV